jgi:hypothetical protein
MSTLPLLITVVAIFGAMRAGDAPWGTRVVLMRPVGRVRLLAAKLWSL